MRAAFLIYADHRLVGACTERCYDAQKVWCLCPCRGNCHAAGYDQAVKIADEIGDRLLGLFAYEHPRLRNLELRTEDKTFGPIRTEHEKECPNDPISTPHPQ